MKTINILLAVFAVYLLSILLIQLIGNNRIEIKKLQSRLDSLEMIKPVDTIEIWYVQPMNIDSFKLNPENNLP